MGTVGRFKAALSAGAFAIALVAAPAKAQETGDDIRDRIERLEQELSALKTQVASGREVGEEPQGAASVGAVAAPARPEPSSRRPTWIDGPLSGSRALIAGYAHVGAAFSDKDSPGGSTFVAGTLNPALYFQYGDWLLFEGEAEIEIGDSGETEFTLEYSQLDLLLHDNVTLVVGKYLSPVGQFQERLHPSWINRLADAPAGFGHEGVQPGAEVGVQLRGGLPFGRSRLTYAMALGNGPRLDPAGAVMTEGFGRDDNGNKAFSGRIGFLPLPFVEVGFSFLTTKVEGAIAGAEGGHGEETAMLSVGPASASEEAEPEGAVLPAVRYSLWGVDAAFTRGPWDVRFEYLRGVRRAIPVVDDEGMPMDPIPRLRMEAWYGQVAYRLSGITQHRILQNFEPAIRYGEYKIRGLEELAEEAAEKRFDVGLNYWFAPSIVLHGAIQRRRFTARDEGETNADTRFLTQLSYGF